eukprot:16105-Heterococcus_DN1.PRE.1
MAAVESHHELQNQFTLPAGAKPDDRQSSSLTSKMIELHGLKEVDESASSELTRPDNPAILSFKGTQSSWQFATGTSHPPMLHAGCSAHLRPGIKFCSKASRAKSKGGLLLSWDPQDDLLNGNLTCEETLLYTARLRCPQDTSEAQRKLRVDRVLSEMGLEHARHTVVGTPMKKGISGGERKRLCVGIELLGDPKLLFLVLLKAGEIAYQGPAKDALAYFEQT